MTKTIVLLVVASQLADLALFGLVVPRFGIEAELGLDARAVRRGIKGRPPCSWRTMGVFG
jgi:hypothetical protein